MKSNLMNKLTEIVLFLFTQNHRFKIVYKNNINSLGSKLMFLKIIVYYKVILSGYVLRAIVDILYTRKLGIEQINGKN